MSLDEDVDKSFNLYLRATEKFKVVPMERKDYKELLLNALYALRDCYSQRGADPYVIVKANDLYMKAKKLGDNLEISYMDKETFQLTTSFNPKD
ncbi:MAG TPA: hypothetical protein VI911_10470 [Patescibacteria group bacterium]|nr:hypothetical protein [Patescibacteria group bacterium]